MTQSFPIEELVPGDILLYRTTSLMGKAIRLLDGTDVSHAALFVGDGVAEALVREGLTQRPVADSISDGTKWVAVMRKEPVPGPITPVLEIAESYLNEGNRYGYEQILLLAGICLTRKLDLDNPILRRLIRAAMRKAVDLIEHFHGEEKEPMICSEFVFRTYEEAKPGSDDLYSLEILSQSATPSRHFSRFRRLRQWFSTDTPPEIPVVDPDSLLGQLEKAGECVESLPESDRLKSILPAPDDDLESIIEQFLAETDDQKSSRSLWAATPDISTDELLDTARLFASTLTASSARKIEIENTMYGAPTDTDMAPKSFNEILADFVTPGDLLKSPSLEEVGRIENH